MAEPAFRFKGRAVGVDRSGYYHARWDQAESISVLAATRKDALAKAFTMLGPHQRAGFEWRIKWDSIDEDSTRKDQD